jgi:hypothetical protein
MFKTDLFLNGVSMKYLLLVFSFFTFVSTSQDFQGWQGLRVIAHEGSASHLTVVDLEGEGRESLFTLNRRQSRIDIYSYVPKSKRGKVGASKEKPNELSFPEDFKRDEIPLDRVPVLLNVSNIDKDKAAEVLVVTINPLTLHLYDYEDSKWSLTSSWRLPKEKFQYTPLLVKENKAYISTSKGVMVQELKAGVTTKWLLPLEKNVTRMKWWMVDVNNDGVDDLLELVPSEDGKLSFRVKEQLNGEFLPSVPLGKVKADAADIEVSKAEFKFFLKNAVRENTISSYILEKAEQRPFGENRLLPLLNSSGALRTTVMLDKKPCVVEIDPDRPQMRVSVKDGSGFRELGKFPVLRNVKSISAPLGNESVLYQVTGSSDLYISYWKNGRFTFPKIFRMDISNELKKILGMGRQANFVWWAQSVGDDLFLFKWEPGKGKPSKTLYKGIGKGIDKVFWLSGNIIMLRKKYAKFASFYTIKEDKVTVLNADHMKDATELQFRLFDLDGKVLIARLVDGILQWIDNELQPTDQVMLDNGQRIGDCVLNKDGSMFVLSSNGQSLFRLEKDKSGVMRQKAEFEILAAESIKNDPCLGMTFGAKTFLNVAVDGRPNKFKLVNTINSKIGLPTGEKKGAIHRFVLEDVTGDSSKELLLCDYSRHQLTLVDLSKGKPQALSSWKVFDDGKYPYSDGQGNGYSSRQPYVIKALDFDGDGINELLMPCHDRILIYIGKEDK